MKSALKVVEGPVYQDDDGDGNLATNPRRNDCDLRLNHGYELKGFDVDTLRRMALSTSIGTEFAETPLMRHLIDILVETCKKRLCLRCHKERCVRSRYVCC